jgi:hypothetical protein
MTKPTADTAPTTTNSAGTVGATEKPSWASDVVHSSTDGMPQRPYTETLINGTKVEHA